MNLLLSDINPDVLNLGPIFDQDSDEVISKLVDGPGSQYFTFDTSSGALTVDLIGLNKTKS